MRTLIDSILPIEILAALPPPSIPGTSFRPRGGNLSFYRSQSEWLDSAAVTILPFADYVAGLREVVDRFGGNGASVEVPQINAAAGPLRMLSIAETELILAYYGETTI